jgi:hypothetical protein
VLGAVVFSLLGAAAPALATGVPVPTPAPTYRWMDGNGVAFSELGRPVPHSFSLRCDVTAMGYPNYLVIRWSDPAGNNFRFTLHTLDESSCFYQTAPSLMCDQIVFDCFDTIRGTGTGSIESWGPLDNVNPLGTDCQDCGFVEFRFSDNGPAKTGELLQSTPYDDGTFTVSSFILGDAVVVGCVDCPPSRADYRAHQRGTCSQS